MENSSLLTFKEIRILSLKEEKAYQVKFGKRLNVILGGNDAGKSSLLKSLYYAFGADIRISKRWRKANPIIFLSFSVKGNDYSIFRERKTIALFNSNNELIRLFEEEPLEMSIFFADYFDFKIELADKDFNMVIPPLSFLFLPYYIDQDDGWQKNWNSIKKSVLKSGRQEIIPYHAGIKTNKEFALQNEIKKLRGFINESERDIRLLRKIAREVEVELETISMNVNVEDFKQEIDKLLTVTNQLNNKRQVYVNKVTSFREQKIEISEQIRITEKALNEIRKDYNFLLAVEDEVINCPTCGTRHENSFVQRFEIAQNENEIFDTLSELYEENESLDKKIKKHKDGLDANEEEFLKITAILSERKKQVKLNDLIENEGKRSMQVNLKNQITDLEDKQAKFASEWMRKKESLKDTKNQERVNVIKGEYKKRMDLYLKTLNVNNADEKDYKEIGSYIVNNDIGNTVPRMLLSYYFTFFHIMRKYSSTVFCPIVIDSPNQNAPDKPNLIKIIDFIFKEIPKGCQAFIGLEDTLDVPHNGKIIALEKDTDLLQESQYKKVKKSLESILIVISQNRRKSLL